MDTTIPSVQHFPLLLRNAPSLSPTRGRKAAPCTKRSCPPTTGDWARAGCLDPSDPIRDPALQPFLSSLFSQKEAAILGKCVPLQVQSGAGRDSTEATSSSLVPINNKADCLERRRVISRPLQAPILLNSKGKLQSTRYHGTFTVQ